MFRFTFFFAAKNGALKFSNFANILWNQVVDKKNVNSALTIKMLYGINNANGI